MIARRSKRIAIASVCLPLLAAACLFSCGDGDNSVRESPPSAPAGTTRSLRIEVGAERRVVSIVPAIDALPPGASTNSAQSLRTLGINGVLPGVPATALLYGAATSLGDLVVLGDLAPTDGVSDAPPPWTSNHWFIFNTPPTTCDSLLRHEQILASMADRLSELSETVNIVEWNVGPLFSRLPSPWRILPQSDLNRFVARDMAIYTLANLAQLNGSKLTFPAVGQTYPQVDLSCAEAFAQARAHADWAAGVSNLLFSKDDAKPAGVAVYPADADLNTAVDQRLALDAHTLRAGARMLHDLVQAGVYADLAGAADRAGHASDSSRANREIWGEEDPYDSLAHAMRLVAGRWDTYNDPGPLQLLPQLGYKSGSLYGNISYSEKVLREADLPISNQAQADAAALMQHAGIVLDTSKLQGTSPIRAIIQPELMVLAAIAAGKADPAAGCTVPAGFETSAEGLRVTEALGNVSDADLAFGANYAAHTFQLVSRTNALPTASAGWPPSTDTLLTPLPAACIVPGLQPYGTVVKGRLGRDLLPTDITPRALETWFTAPGTWTDFSTDWQNVSVTAPSHLIFQDSFAIGRALGYRLGQVAAVTGAFGTNDANDTAKDAVAEMRPWAGSGTVTVDFETNNAPACEAMPGDGVDAGGTPCLGDAIITMTGFVPYDLGIDTIDPLSVASVLQFTPDAECALGLRPDCPPAALTAPASIQVGANGDPTVIVLRTARVTVKTDGRPTLPRYVVSTKPAKGTRRAFIAPLAYGEAYQDSPMRRDLFNAMFGFSDGERSHDPRPGDTGAGQPHAYCIPGVARDTFVPLSNELTADGSQFEDSWRHYLTVAQQAAARADDLAQQIINIGTQQDTRREQAAQQLGQLCGDISALDQVGVNGNGTIDTSNADDSLKSCLGEARYDVVFLADVTSVLTDGTEGVAARDALSKYLKCDQNPDDDICKRLSAGAPVAVCKGDGTSPWLGHADHVTVCGLRLFKTQLSDASTPTCGDVTNVADGLRGTAATSFDAAAFGAMLQKGWTAPDSLHAIGYGLQLAVGSDGNWTLSSGDILMSSAVSPDGKQAAWPACRRAGAPACSGPNDPLYDELFRVRCANGTYACPLGEPEGGNETAEMNAIRWRVSGALWTLGMLGGGVTEGMFATPLPAFSFGDAPANSSVPLATIYGAGFYTSATNGARFLDGVRSTPDDAQVLGEVDPMSSSFAAWSGVTQPKLPSWYADIYTGPNAAYFLQTKTLVQNAEQPADRPERFNSDYALGAVRPLAKAARCPSYYGSIDGTNDAAVLAQVARIKANWSRQDRLATTGRNGNWFAPDGDGTIHYNPNATDHAFEHAYVYGWPQALPSGYARLDETSVNRPIDIQCLDPFQNEATDNEGVTLAPCRATSATGYKTGENFFYNMSAADMSPAQRVKTFVNSSPPPDGCSALGDLVGAYALACAAGVVDAGQVPQTLPDPPVLNSESDLGRYQRWLSLLEAAVKDHAARQYTRGVPARAVQDQRAARVVQGSLKGDHGTTIVGIENGLAAAGSDWITLANAIHDLNDDLGKTRAVVKGLDQATEAQVNALSFQLARAIAADASGIVSDVFSAVAGGGMHGSGNIGGPIADAVGKGADLVITAIDINNQIHAARDQNANQVFQTLLDLSKQSTDTISLLEKTLTALRTDLNTVSNLGDTLRSQEDQGSYLAAQGLGADYVVTANGATTAIPLNTVLRRQFDGLQQRYKSALTQAKGLAFLARRAIEQRVGVSMTDMHDSVGPLDAPATWADSVCHMTGIDYSQLRSIGETTAADAGIDGAVQLEPANGDGGYDREQIDVYADGFIGDYVAKLQSFVDYYNVQYPSHQSDDIAVLSLREDFLPRAQQCLARGSNVLYYSSQLWQQPTDDVASGSKAGWEYHPCISSAKCLTAKRAVGTTAPPSDAVGSHVTLLSDGALPTVVGSGADGGVGDASTGDGGAPSSDPRGRVNGSAPPGYVSQAVHVDPGSYVLSWWDHAQPVGQAVILTPYRVVVFDDSWTAVAQFSDSAPPDWSDRRSIAFDVSGPSTYHVAFAASGSSGDPGAVLIAGIQLEKASNNGAATAYIETSASLDTYTALCPSPSMSTLQGAFTRRCDDPTGACYYELNAPMAIDVVGLQTGSSPLSGKIARGNFNYRHVNVALNLVGTGVRTCPDGSSQSCYGSGYTEYSLYHDAEQVPILDYSGTPHYFDFETGRIEHGKALSAERYITMPLSSADSSLISQPGIQKVELQGRPLDGPYRLRIWDNPALRWDRLEDVQFVLQYRYWSKVDQGTPGTH